MEKKSKNSWAPSTGQGRLMDRFGALPPAPKKFGRGEKVIYSAKAKNNTVIYPASKKG